MLIPRVLMLHQRMPRLPSIISPSPFKTIFKPSQTIISRPFFSTNAIKGRQHLLHYDWKTTKHPLLDGRVLLMGPGNLLSDIEHAPFLCRKSQLGLHGFDMPLGYNLWGDRRAEEDAFQSAMWGPINGVYCAMIKAELSGRSTVLLWNPRIRQYHVLPPIPQPFFPSNIVKYLDIGGEFDLERIVCGYGYDPSTNDYKIILINIYGEEDHDKYHHYCFNLYSLATNKWKRLDPFKIIKNKYLMKVESDGVLAFNTDIDYSLYNCCDDGIYLNGACHWLIFGFFENYDGLLSFNFSNVGFHFTPFPTAVIESVVGNNGIQRLTTVNGLLALVIPLDYDRHKETSSSFEVWLMREYGVEESWIRAYKVALMSPGCYIGIVDNEFFVLEAYNEKWKVVSYCLATQQRCEYCEVNDDNLGILPFRESLMSVKPNEGSLAVSRRGG